MRLRSQILDNRSKRRGIQAGPADQSPVDILALHQRRDIVGLHAAAIQNANRSGSSGAMNLQYRLPDFEMHLFGDLGRGGPTGSDGPYRFVSDRDVGQLLL